MKNFYENILHNLYDGLYFVDRRRKITFWNKAAEEITGYSQEEVEGHFCFDNILDHVDLQGNHMCNSGCPLHATMEDGQSREAAVYLRHKNGYRKAVSVKTMPMYENGEIIGAIEIFNDNVDLFKTLQELSNYKAKAFTDQLTGLPNRHYLEEYISTSKFFKNMKASIIFMDIDNFKFVNDTYGHPYGDEVLIEVGRVIRTNIKRSDEVFRYGGEEFMAVIFDDNFDNAVKVAERIRIAVENLKMKYEDTPTPLTISLGVTMVEENEDLMEAIERSDKYMYNSKVTGKNKVTSKL